MELYLIKDTVQQVADAITAALEIETEIVDNRLQIIAGTGRYFHKVGVYEEDGDLNSPYIYGHLLRTGEAYYSDNPQSDPIYNAMEGELAEITCPIKLNDRMLGLIGLIALTPKQRNIIIQKRPELSSFLKIMADLIVGRFLMEVKVDSLRETIDSISGNTPFMDGAGAFDAIIGESSVMTKLKQRALQVSSSDSTVLITGESGTGKELLARAIHGASPRNGKPFVAINCGAIPEMLLESELFGYEKGAFTGADKHGKLGKFQLADAGTIFLDEIGDMPLHMQVKLLRVIQTRQVEKVGGYEPVDINVRIIAATNRNLEELIRQNKFREDLYFRLNVIPLFIPPLRDRPDDVKALLDHAFLKFNDKLDKRLSGISSEAYHHLMHYAWPGNVRELENAMEYAVNMEDSHSIRADNLPDKIYAKDRNISAADFKHQTAEYQRQMIVNVLNETGWTLEGKRKAAEMLGISQSTLYRRLRKK